MTAGSVLAARPPSKVSDPIATTSGPRAQELFAFGHDPFPMDRARTVKFYPSGDPSECLEVIVEHLTQPRSRQGAVLEPCTLVGGRLLSFNGGPETWLLGTYEPDTGVGEFTKYAECPYSLPEPLG